jgi:arylsulfatase A-like enzyme
MMGYRNAQHRPHRPRGHDLHRLLRPAELHRRPRAFITGSERVPHRHDQGRHARRRTGLQKDPTIAGGAQGLGYATGQFGKNHQGDRDEHLPTNHGFDEFFGNLYHLNAEEEPENEDYPGDMVLANGRTFASSSARAA